ncbi:MAG: DUF302 domain-containing protein [Gemmatimonadaceae bacterium]
MPAVSSPAPYVIGVHAAGDYDAVVARTRAELLKEGFGVISEIDIAATLKNKLGVDAPPQVILGACNPGFAHQALLAEPEIGTLLPCNVVVRQDGARVAVSAMDPVAALSLTKNDRVAQVAGEVRERLARALAAVAEGAK